MHPDRTARPTVAALPPERAALVRLADALDELEKLRALVAGGSPRGTGRTTRTLQHAARLAIADRRVCVVFGTTAARRAASLFRLEGLGRVHLADLDEPHLLRGADFDHVLEDHTVAEELVRRWRTEHHPKGAR